MGATLFKALLWVWGTLIVGIGINWVSSVIEWKSLQDHPWLAGAGLLLLAGGTGWTYRFYRFAEAAKHFALFKEAKDLLPEDLDFQEQKPGAKPNPDYRPYNTTYIPRKAEALAAYERALELWPDHIDTWRNVARSAEAQGDFVKAEKARLEVLRLEREEKEKKT